MKGWRIGEIGGYTVSYYKYSGHSYLSLSPQERDCRTTAKPCYTFIRAQMSVFEPQVVAAVLRNSSLMAPKDRGEIFCKKWTESVSNETVLDGFSGLT